MATIIFDLDDTLYDTARFKKDIERVFVSRGFSKADVWESYKKAGFDKGYTFEIHLQELAKICRDLEPVAFLPKLLALFKEDYIFPWVIKTLKQLRNSHTLVLLTLGEKGFQQLKIENADIKKYFDFIHITEKEKEKLLRHLNFQGKIYFINNNVVENEKIRKHFPHFIVIDAKSGEPVVIPSSPLD